ncbi:MAG: MlaD family protein, partial [Planctomycetes bacterium]|nr:MlaD family protein [Planctomycetota bacterium]
MAGRKQTATMELAIGASIIAAVIILIVMLMAWGNSSSILGSHYRVVVNMVNVGGLKEGAPVKMGGFQIGRVASIQIRPGGTDMEIVLDIDESRSLPRDSTAKVSTAGLVGDAFMEIIPGTSAESLRRAATVAEADRLESSPLPDLSELFVKVNEFGDQLTILTTNLNDIVGDPEFRRNVKSLATNMDALSYQANLILQRGQVVMDSIEKVAANAEKAAENVASLSVTLNESVARVTDN